VAVVTGFFQSIQMTQTCLDPKLTGSLPLLESRLFCFIARSVGWNADKPSGGFYRRLKERRGGLAANLALARKLAELFWRVMDAWPGSRGGRTQRFYKTRS
jgi:hypothetical protein